MAVPLDLKAVAYRLGGDALPGGRVLAPGPGHSPHDCSLLVTADASAPEGFLVHSFAGDPFGLCRDYVRERFGLSCLMPLTEKPLNSGSSGGDAQRIALAETIWGEGKPCVGTPVERYLARRGVALPTESEAVRWHPSCPFGQQRHACMVARVVDLRTNEFLGIHRTAVTPDGHKMSQLGGNGRLSLGPIKNGAVKLTPDAHTTLSLGIGEGLESALSLRRLEGCDELSVWAVLTASSVGSFPVLSGIESLWVAVDNDEAGLQSARKVAERWQEAGREVVALSPRTPRADLNDLAVRASS